MPWLFLGHKKSNDWQRKKGLTESFQAGLIGANRGPVILSGNESRYSQTG